MTSPQKISLTLTSLTALLLILLLQMAGLGVPQTPDWPPKHKAEIAINEQEEFFDVITEAPEPMAAHEEAAQTFAPQPSKNASTPAPRAGHDVADAGPAGDAPAVATQATPSPVKQKTEPTTKPTGPSHEELEQQRLQEEARRRATAATASAFQRSQGANNTAAKGKNEGDTGSPTGTSRGLNGTGTGSVGGGWRLPQYAKVPATITGSIKVRVTVGPDGRVTGLTFEGGDAPAATDPALRHAVRNEVMGRRFTRPSMADAPEQATAYITYRFK